MSACSKWLIMHACQLFISQVLYYCGIDNSVAKCAVYRQTNHQAALQKEGIMAKLLQHRRLTPYMAMIMWKTNYSLGCPPSNDMAMSRL